jgi:hypothetical protein
MSLSDEDELFSSLANQLLADLQVDDGDAGWLSLDQLESELAQLDASSSRFSINNASELAPTSAASLVLSHAPNSIPQYATAEPGVDAWSISLQRFTASALEEDFLSANAARKTTVAAPPRLDFSNAQEYNIAEPPQPFLPPPGIPADPSQQLLSDAATKLVQEISTQESSASDAQPTPLRRTMKSDQRQTSINAMDLPQPHAFPQTPQNSIYFEASTTAPTPPPSAQPTPAMQRNIHQAMSTQSPHPPTMPVPAVAPHPSTAPGQSMAWQTPPPQPNPHMVQMSSPNPRRMPTPMPRVYCNSHPRAPPIPAQQLASKYMNARDISYVVHSMLKSMLTIPADLEADYQFQLLRRSGLPNQPQNNYKNKMDIIQDLASRQKKSQEWSNEKHALGHITKTNGLRPRSLIAPFVSAASAEHDSSNKQRASLWKARIYCDQAHQAYAQVVESWRTAAPGQVPPAVQIHLQRLLKCFGMASPTEIDPAPLALLLKLRKGRVLVARVLEQALVPPKAVHTLLPVLLHTLTASPPPKDDSASDDRLCLALARVIATVPELTDDALVESARAVLQNGSVALSSESRMHCVHALLQRGSVSQTEEWNQVEAEFMKLLSGM